MTDKTPLTDDIDVSGKDDFLGFDSEESLSFQPQEMTEDTFRQRNDPLELLDRFKLQLMNAYKKEVWIKDKDTGEVTKQMRLFKIKTSKPRANKRGQQEIISYVEKIVNRHSVQGNLDSLDEYRNRMRYISNDITMHFIAKRDDWGVDIGDIDELVSTTINLVDLFLTRTLFNEERKGYGETYKESINKDISTPEKPNPFQKAAAYLTGRGKK